MPNLKAITLLTLTITAVDVSAADSIKDVPYCRDIEQLIPYDYMSVSEGAMIKNQNARAMKYLGHTIGTFCSKKHGLNLDRVKHCIASRSLDYAKLFSKMAEMVEAGDMPPEMWQ